VGDACAAEAVGNLKAMCEGIDTRWVSFKRIIHTLVSTMKVSHRFEVKDLRWIAHLLIDMNVNGIEAHIYDAHRLMKLAAVCLTKTLSVI
jgi:hypothetical protein